LSLAGYLFINPGDKILVADKFWGNYRLIFANGFGGELVPFNTFTDAGFDTNALKQALAASSGKTIVILNFPNNPTGYTPTIAEADAIVGLLKNHAAAGNQTLVICDDAYFGLVYEDNIYRESLFSPLATCSENLLAIKADGPTKEDYVWGFRVGFLTYGIKGLTETAAAALEAKTAGAIRGNVSNVANISQNLLIEGFATADYEAAKKEKFNILQRRYQKVKAILKDPKFAELVVPLPYNSGYFMCMAVKDGLDAEKVRLRLLEKYDTGLIVIGDLLRVAYSAIPTDKLPLLFDNIYNACRECR